MCSMSVLCPLCCSTKFSSIDALRVSLIKAANGPLQCPLCHEMFLGLDKLTIHLFSHSSLMETSQTEEAEVPQVKETCESEGQNMHINELDKLAKAVSPTNMTKEKKIKKSKSISKESNMPTSPTLDIADTLSTCDICEFTFRNSELRDMHVRLVHQNLNAMLNDTCAQTMAADVPDFKCHLCAKTFKMKGSLRVHLKVVHHMGLPYVNNSPKLGICDRIRHKEAKSFHKSSSSNKLNLMSNSIYEDSNYQMTNVNQQTMVPVMSSQVQTQLSPTLNLNRNDQDSMINCHNVIEPMNTNVLLLFNNGTNISMNLGPELDNEESITKSNDPNPKIWECDVCSKAFTTKYFLKKHKRLHTGEMPYTCEICARTFTFQQSYHKHLLYHSDEKPHVCGVCGRAFKELSTLHNHERIHSGEKPFKCEICGKSFRQRVSFLVHTRIHTGAMPYKCDLCQKSFRYKVSQRTHKCVNQLETLENVGATDENSEQMSENFIKAFLESTSVPMNEAQHSPASAEIAHINSNSNSFNEVMLTQAIDQIVVDSCKQLGIEDKEQNMPVLPLNSFMSSQHNHDEGSNSPLHKFQNMRLYSPQLESVSPQQGDMENCSLSGYL